MPPNMAPIGGGGHATRPAPKATQVPTPNRVAGLVATTLV